GVKQHPRLFSLLRLTRSCYTLLQSRRGAATRQTVALMEEVLMLSRPPGAGRTLALLVVACWLHPAAAQSPPGPDRQARLSALLTGADSKDAATRLHAAIGLQDFGPEAAPAVPALVASLHGKSEHLRLNAALALGKIGKAAVPTLRKALDG